MRSIISHFGAGGAVLALVLALAPESAAAQTGLSTSGVYVTDYSNTTNSCGHFSTPSSSTSEATSGIPGCGTVVGGSASATSSSSNSSRSASALGTSTQTGTLGQTYAVGHGYSTQYSKLTVAGLASATDNLVFHFFTAQSETGNVNSNSGYGFWNLTLAGGTNDPVFAQQTAGGGLLLGSGATQTAQGFDFIMPFTPTSGVFQYNFTVDAYGYVTGHATGNTTQTASISAMLAGVDQVSASGAFIRSATFDQNGFGTFGAAPNGPPSTVPEPSSVALLGSGLVGLIPVLRRKSR